MNTEKATEENNGDNGGHGCLLSISDLDEQSEATNDWPSCWTFEQKNEFCSKNEWL